MSFDDGEVACSIRFSLPVPVIGRFEPRNNQREFHFRPAYPVGRFFLSGGRDWNPKARCAKTRCIAPMRPVATETGTVQWQT